MTISHIHDIHDIVIIPASLLAERLIVILISSYYKYLLEDIEKQIFEVFGGGYHKTNIWWKILLKKNLGKICLILSLHPSDNLIFSQITSSKEIVFHTTGAEI